MIQSCTHGPLLWSEVRLSRAQEIIEGLCHACENGIALWLRAGSNLVVLNETVAKREGHHISNARTHPFNTFATQTHNCAWLYCGLRYFGNFQARCQSGGERLPRTSFIQDPPPRLSPQKTKPHPPLAQPGTYRHDSVVWVTSSTRAPN